MRFLLVAENNSLSHFAKALAIRRGLTELGHDVLLGVGQRWESYLVGSDICYAVLPEIRDHDFSGFPGVPWFNNVSGLEHVINAERQLIDSYKPDRVLGIFRFTLKASAAIAEVPCDSLICGCLLPGACDAYGYLPDEPGASKQADLMSGFFRYAGKQLSLAMNRHGLPGIRDAREMLLGKRTFLWDFPDFFECKLPASCIHVGMPEWSMDVPEYQDFELFENRPLAVLTFGTCVGEGASVRFITQQLNELGFHVLLAGGGQTKVIEGIEDKPWLTVRQFAPLHRLWNRVRLLVSHGGQATVFEALRHKIPVAVLPFQPEQAHNGVCLEQIGCGLRLSCGQPFLGNSIVYEQAMLAAGVRQSKRENRAAF